MAIFIVQHHYEGFRAYHESFYRFVEPTGATPFSKPARERALHAVITAIIRQRTGLCEDRDAINFDKEYFKEIISDVEAFIIGRVKRINDRAGNKLNDNVEEIRTEIISFIDKWQEIVDECYEDAQPVPLYFGRRFMVCSPTMGERRLLKQYNSSGQDSAFKTLTSMRNVDTQVNGSVVIWEEKDND